MNYAVKGLDPAPFSDLFAASDAERSARLAELVTATSDTGFPCRVSLQNAREGERVLLVHHVSNDVQKPFRMAHAIYVREGSERAREYRGNLPRMLDTRTIGLRAFDETGMMRMAVLAPPGEADGAIRGLFADLGIAYIHAHNAAYGCFLAAVERCDD